MWPIVGLIAFIAIGFAATLFGYWYFQAFALGVPLIAVIVAIFRRDHWPVVEPAYGLFFIFPLMLVVLDLFRLVIFTSPVIDWGQWMGWSIAIALAVTLAITLAWRRHIDREWAVVSTFLALCVYMLNATDVVNRGIPQDYATCTRAGVVEREMGGRRNPGPRITIAPLAPYAGESTHPVSWDTYNASEDHQAALCLYDYPGVLGWRWTALDRC